LTLFVKLKGEETSSKTSITFGKIDRFKFEIGAGVALRIQLQILHYGPQHYRVALTHGALFKRDKGRCDERGNGSNQKKRVAILSPRVLGRRQFELLALYNGV
jgi:hypothetical protein